MNINEVSFHLYLDFGIHVRVHIRAHIRESTCVGSRQLHQNTPTIMAVQHPNMTSSPLQYRPGASHRLDGVTALVVLWKCPAAYRGFFDGLPLRFGRCNT